MDTKHGSTFSGLKFNLSTYAMSVQGFFIKPNSITALQDIIRIIVEYWMHCYSPSLNGEKEQRKSLSFGPVLYKISITLHPGLFELMSNHINEKKTLTLVP